MHKYIYMHENIWIYVGEMPAKANWTMFSVFLCFDCLLVSTQKPMPNHRDTEQQTNWTPTDSQANCAPPNWPKTKQTTKNESENKKIELDYWQLNRCSCYIPYSNANKHKNCNNSKSNNTKQYKYNKSRKKANCLAKITLQNDFVAYLKSCQFQINSFVCL